MALRYGGEITWPRDRYECDRNRLRLSLEDRLSDAQQAELAGHLECCLDCRRELEADGGRQPILG